MNRNYPVKKTPYVKPEMKPELPPNGTFWKCGGCGSDNFGKFIDGVLHIKYRERIMTASGVISVHCRACGTVNTIDLAAYPYEVNIHFGADDYQIEITEAALRLAQQNNINIKTLQGSGKEGKIVTGDVKKLID